MDERKKDGKKRADERPGERSGERRAQRDRPSDRHDERLGEARRGVQRTVEQSRARPTPGEHEATCASCGAKFQSRAERIEGNAEYCANCGGEPAQERPGQERASY